jgi:conjugative transposon TraN protein
MDMRLNILMAAAILFGLVTSTFSQSSLEITYSKTTSLVFKYPIVNVDRGSADFIAQRVKGVDNTLQIKATRKGFPETNLTVITADGNLHHFYVHYSEHPGTQTFVIDSVCAEVRFADGLNIGEYKYKTNQILQVSRQGRLERDAQFKIRLSLNAIYIEGNQVFYDLSIRNNSNVDYDIQSLRFFIRDSKKVKRTAFQERELTPVFVSNSESAIKGKSTLRIVYALEKFTIPDAKTLDIELFEKNGGRNLKLRIKNKAIVNAKNLRK